MFLCLGAFSPLPCTLYYLRMVTNCITCRLYIGRSGTDKVLSRVYLHIWGLFSLFWKCLPHFFSFLGNAEFSPLTCQASNTVSFWFSSGHLTTCRLSDPKRKTTELSICTQKHAVFFSQALNALQFLHTLGHFLMPSDVFCILPKVYNYHHWKYSLIHDTCHYQNWIRRDVSTT